MRGVGDMGAMLRNHQPIAILANRETHEVRGARQLYFGLLLRRRPGNLPFVDISRVHDLRPDQRASQGTKCRREIQDFHSLTHSFPRSLMRPLYGGIQ